MDSPFDLLCDETLTDEIFPSLSLTDLLRLGRTNHRMNTLVRDYIRPSVPFPPSIEEQMLIWTSPDGWARSEGDRARRRAANVAIRNWIATVGERDGWGLHARFLTVSREDLYHRASADDINDFLDEYADSMIRLSHELRYLSLYALEATELSLNLNYDTGIVGRHHSTLCRAISSCRVFIEVLIRDQHKFREVISNEKVNAAFEAFEHTERLALYYMLRLAKKLSENGFEGLGWFPLNALAGDLRLLSCGVHGISTCVKLYPERPDDSRWLDETEVTAMVNTIRDALGAGWRTRY